MNRRPFHALAFLLALSGLTLVGCGSTPPSGADGGVDDAGNPDAGPPDAGPPFECTDATRVDGMMDGTVQVMFDTSMTETRPRDLGLGCGNTSPSARWAPQEVIEFHVPGTGRVAVDVDTTGSGTQNDFNTLFQVRERCEAVPAAPFPPSCFDDTSASELAASGSFMAEGGSTVYVIVTGFSEPPAEQRAVDEGRVDVSIGVRDNAAPTATSGSLVLALADTVVDAAGMDADADVIGVAMNFYGPTGTLLDVYGDGSATLDGDAFFLPFDRVTGGTDYAGTLRVDGTRIGLANFLRQVNAAEADLRVFDRAYETSAPLRVEIIDAEQVGFGAACDVRNVCSPPLTCTGAGGTTCDVTGPARVLCDMAPALMIAPVADTAQTATATGRVGGAAGVWEGSMCGTMPANATAGNELVYSLTLPEGSWDVTATTAGATTGGTDTVLYIRSNCLDPLSQVGACSDDIGGMNLASQVNLQAVGAGTYAVFVEQFAGGRGAANVQVSVRVSAVIPSGGACDMARMQNRCATGTCTAGLCP